MSNCLAKGKQAVILIIADASPDRLALSEILARQGYVVSPLPPSDVTAQAVAALSPDVLVIDLEHTQALQTMIADNADLFADMAVIFSCATNAALDRARVFAADYADYLLKPYVEGEVLTRVATQLTLRCLQRQVVEKDTQLQQEIAQRHYTETSLQDMNEALEQRIVERTATLRASEAMFRYLLARANDGYVIVDDKERIVYANTQARVFLGLGREIDKAAPPHFNELITKQYRCEPQAAWALWPKKMFVNRKPVPLYLVRPETLTANAFWLQVEILDIAAGLDTEAGRIICINDVTERTAMQDELGRFHAIISHKLRTPLVPLYTGLMFLVEQAQTMPRDDIVKFVQNAFEGAQHLYDEVQDIVNYLGAPRTAPLGLAFPLADFEMLVTRIAGELELSNVAVRVADTLQDVELLLSQRSIELIMWELLENAQKFHPHHTPVIAVDVSRIGVQQVRIRVVDDGMTLSPDQLVRMWMPYYQADKYSTGQISGMGLGLSLVATQVWGVGGTCRSYNRDDQPGIVVELVLPCTE